MMHVFIIITPFLPTVLFLLVFPPWSYPKPIGADGLLLHQRSFPSVCQAVKWAISALWF